MALTKTGCPTQHTEATLTFLGLDVEAIFVPLRHARLRNVLVWTREFCVRRIGPVGGRHQAAMRLVGLVLVGICAEVFDSVCAEMLVDLVGSG